MAMKDVFGTQGMTLEFPSTICVGWRSLGITAKTFPKMNMLLILDHSVPNTEQVGRYYHFTAFFFFYRPKHCQWLVPSSNCQPSITQFGQTAEGE